MEVMEKPAAAAQQEEKEIGVWELKDWSSSHDRCDGNGIDFDDHASIGGRGWKMS